MKTLIFFASVLLLKSPVFAYSVATAEPHGCAQFNRFGQMTETHALMLIRDPADKMLKSMSITRHQYWSESLIYKRGTNELVGTSFRRPADPAMPSFEEWQKGCLVPEGCDEKTYQEAKAAYENSSRWIVYPGQISADDKDYYVLETRTETVQKMRLGLTAVGMEGPYQAYESAAPTEAQHEVYITNSVDSKRLVSTSQLQVRIRFLDNPMSYSLRIDKKFPEWSDFDGVAGDVVVCAK